ncbi:MAG: serine/threonine protein kinase [Bdellovibrionales bacterium]|nr:serine/threonine protein kinase [Bdellovibrionales bacterium]
MGGDTTIISTRPALANRFRVLDTLGEGAGSSVYLVSDLEKNGKQVALKVLVNDEAFDEHTLERFRDEMRVCRDLSHPNIIQAYDFIDLGDTIAFSMEYVKGCDLGSMFYEKKEFTPKEIDWIFDQLLSALEELHKRNIVHRDLKLENVLIREDGVVKLSDLGLMKDLNSRGMTRAGVLLGTAQYMPPEYIRSSKYDGRGDLYAVGIMLLEILTGKRRLVDKPGMEAIEHLIKTKFEIPELLLTGLPKKYVSIIRRATQSEPKHRYQSASEMKLDFAKPDEEFSEYGATSMDSNISVKSVATRMFGSSTNSKKSPLGLAVRIVAAVFILLVAGALYLR